MVEIKYKQFVVVPKKPKMSIGKVASQVAHATFMALENQNKYFGAGRLKRKWKKNGMCVIVLQCKDSLELFGIAEYLKQWEISYHLYIDEGLTEVHMGNPTALATGVIPQDKFWIFETMRLFK